MTVRFVNYRLAFYISVFLLSGAVLGLDAHFAAIFLPRLHQGFTIFALVIPSLTIFIFLLTLQWSQPRVEAIVLFVLWTIWLAMGAWSTDIIGTVQCDALAGQRTATKNGDMSAQSYCYEMKVIQAFSWMIFVLCSFAFIILMQLVTQAQRFGRYMIWYEPIQNLGWCVDFLNFENEADMLTSHNQRFGEWPGLYNTTTQPMYAVPYGYPLQAGSGIPQQPGHSIIVQPSANGGPATVTQIPI
ncbi:hypothetical protein GGU10DRAFT_395159 [Lentinula aff. detonsa]|uniref:MARVEL domain-containing protein n=1 Tax=Lentinula aff. detonsa TaxID=2804958 RepID=A0AA38NM22_9AGAR|nr:hypothetical protein GGU10DRAFT_395159 [Lentinula aff. detonsa]